MAEMPDAIKPVKAAGKGIAGKLGGRKPIVYALMAAGIIGIALYMRKRSQNTATLPTADATGTDNPPLDSGAGYPDPTQGASGYVDPGAYGGYPTPDLGAFFDELTNFLGTASATATAQAPSVPDTGGGITVNPPASVVHSTPAPVPASPPKKAAPTTGHKTVVSTPYKTTGAVTGGIGASPSPSAHTAAATSPYGSKYPYQSDRGWYRLVLPPDGSRWHYYGPHDSPKIRIS